MAYQMQYDYQKVKIEKIQKQSVYQYILAILVLTIVVTGVHFGSSILEMMMLGEGEVVQAAVSQMVDNLQDGVMLEDAVAAFCDEIME